MNRVATPALLIFFLLVSIQAHAGKIDARLARVPAQTSVDVIVKFKVGGIEREPARTKPKDRAGYLRQLKSRSATAAKPLAEFLKANGLRIRRDLWHIGSVALTLKAGLLNQLESLPTVDSVVVDDTLPLSLEVTPLSEGVAGWNLNRIGADQLWNLGHRGQGTVIASFDTGVDPNHSEYSSKWIGSPTGWFDPYLERTTPGDTPAAHGTQVMGILVGDTVGVAPGAQWMSAKIYNAQGNVSLSAVHEAFAWALDPDGNPDTDDAPDILNNSWGVVDSTGTCWQEFEPDITVLKNAGIFVVFAAGNQGPIPGSDLSPANNLGSIAVGAIDSADTVSLGSSRGPGACGDWIFPTFVAPGVDVVTSDYTYSGTVPSSFATVTGTSYAAPHIAGGAALLKSAWPLATSDDIYAALENTAVDLGEAGPDSNYGNGVIDLMAAFRYLAPAGCTDADLDGFFGGGPNCGTLDCNDGDPLINPNACDEINDGIDQDCSGADRTTGIACNPVVDNGSSGSGGGGGCFIKTLLQGVSPR